MGLPRFPALLAGLGVAASAQVPHVVAGAGLGDPNPNRVRTFTAAGAPTGTDFSAYAAGRWGVNVSAGGLDAGAGDEILTGPGPGAVFGPQVRSFLAGGTPIGKVNFYAYGTLRYGVNAAAGLLDGDAFEEILTGAGPGTPFGPHVRGFDYDGSSVVPISKVSFFAYATLRFGVNVAAGDVDRDGFAEIVTGPGPSPAFGPQVRGFDYDGTAVAAIPGTSFNACSTGGYGVDVACGDADADGFAEIATAAGPGPIQAARFCGYDVDGGGVAALPGFDATPFPTRYGGEAALHDLDGAGGADLVTGAGRDPAANAQVRAFAYTGSALSPLPGSFDAFPGLTYGVNVAGASFPSAGNGHVVYTLGGRLYRIEAVAGATPEDLTMRLDLLAPGIDRGVNVSPDGQWLLVDTERFDSACAGWSCLALVDAAVTSGGAVRANGQVVHPSQSSAVASGGGLVVYADGGGPHTRDLWAITGSGTSFGAPLLVSAASPYQWNTQPALRADGARILFDCGDQPYGGPGTAICEVAPDGTSFRVVRTPAEPPPGYSPGIALHHADYAPDGSIVFEGDWNGERIWRLPASSSVPVLLGSFPDDNSPCVLPDSRVVSLWLGRSGGNGDHELKAMDPGGAAYVMLLVNQDVADIGIGCGE